MKRIIFSFTVLLVLFSMKSTAYVRYVTTSLNLRYGPGTNYAVITTLPKGTAITIDEDCNCEWVPVEYCGYVGFISTKYLSSQAPRREIKKERQILLSQNVTNSLPRNSIRHYTNVNGSRIQSPTYYNSVPAGATALCRDGTYSFSRNRRGTCSRHGGVARWLNKK